MNIIGWTINCIFTKNGKTKQLIFGDITKIESNDGLYTITIKDRETGEVNAIRLSENKYESLCYDWNIGKWNTNIGYCWSITITNRYYEHRDSARRKKEARLEQERRAKG